MKALICSLFIGLFCQNLRAEPVFKEIPDEVSSDLTQAEKKPEKKLGLELSGTPRMVRKIGKTEVFFKDLKESYFIPSGLAHNRVLSTVQKAIKNNSPIRFRAHGVSRDILTIEEGEETAPKTKQGSQ